MTSCSESPSCPYKEGVKKRKVPLVGLGLFLVFEKKHLLKGCGLRLILRGQGLAPCHGIYVVDVRGFASQRM